MQEPAGQSRLQRILNHRFFGEPRTLPAKRDFDALSHSEQQEAMLWGERSWAGVPIINATFLPIFIYMMGYTIGMSLIMMLNATGSPFQQTSDSEDRTLMYQIFAYTISVAVLVLLILYSEHTARSLVRRWPKRFADKKDHAVRKRLKQVSTALAKYGFIAVLLIFLLGTFYIDGWSGVRFSLTFASPLILMMWFVHRGATRSGAEPCCRKCGYSLPLSDALPERCSECGVVLTEPWGRVLGRSRRHGLWWVYFGLLMLMPIAVSAAESYFFR